MRRALARLAGWLLKKRFVGRKAYRVAMLDGLPVIAGEGKIIAAGMEPAKQRFVVKFIENGHTLAHARTIDVRDMRWDRHLKTGVFND